MTNVVVQFAPSGSMLAAGERIQVMVRVHADVLAPEAAMHKAHRWLTETISNLLEVTKPELLIGERLLWRFAVMLALPNETQPGSGALYPVGEILLDAVTGEIEDAEALAQELRVHIASIAP